MDARTVLILGTLAIFAVQQTFKVQYVPLFELWEEVQVYI